MCQADRDGRDGDVSSHFTVGLVRREEFSDRRRVVAGWEHGLHHDVREAVCDGGLGVGTVVDDDVDEVLSVRTVVDDAVDVIVLVCGLDQGHVKVRLGLGVT